MACFFLELDKVACAYFERLRITASTSRYRLGNKGPIVYFRGIILHGLGEKVKLVCARSQPSC
jgi:hypothetical protein